MNLLEKYSLPENFFDYSIEEIQDYYEKNPETAESIKKDCSVIAEALVDIYEAAVRMAHSKFSKICRLAQRYKTTALVIFSASKKERHYLHSKKYRIRKKYFNRIKRRTEKR